MVGAVKGAVGKRVVLIVDDDEVQRMVLRHEMEKSGFHVREAVNGQAGLAAVGDFHPDIIITDLMMPVMDGFTFIAAVRKTDGVSTVPIIAVSGSRAEGMGERAVESGANQFYDKSASLHILMAAVENHLTGDGQSADGEIITI